MYLLLRSYRRGSHSSASPETVTVLEAENVGRRDSRRSNRGKVRHYYREFLKMERKRGMKLRKDYTTADILQRISGKLPRRWTKGESPASGTDVMPSLCMMR